ncbi:MAG: alpha/beta hydrolase [Actinoplanes sp.]
MSEAVTVLLVHGGLWEDMDAERFWHRPGITAGLRQHDVEVLAPDRLDRAVSWADEAAHLAGALPERPVAVVAGSNGCSAAVRLALDRPELVARLLLAWPATAGDPEVDVHAPEGVGVMLDGGILRGVDDKELASVTVPVGLLPSVPANLAHQRRTVDALRKAWPHAVELPGCPEPPRPDFAPHAASFVDTVVRFVRG